ncbi:MAG: hypothetical protein Q9221_006660 [Calogaya cf. arnoldii]
MGRSLDGQHAVNQGQRFSRFLELPKHLRKTVYRYASVPAEGLIHPYIGAWFDDISRNLIPLLLANHQIYKETQEVFFDSTTWTPLSAHYTRTFFEFLHSLPKPVLNRLMHLKAFLGYGVDSYEHLSHLVAPIISDLHLETFLLQSSTFIEDVKTITDISTANPARKMPTPSKDTQRILNALYFVQLDEHDGSRRVDSWGEDVLSQWMQMHLQEAQNRLNRGQALTFSEHTCAKCLTTGGECIYQSRRAFHDYISGKAYKEGYSEGQNHHRVSETLVQVSLECRGFTVTAVRVLYDVFRYILICPGES